MKSLQMVVVMRVESGGSSVLDILAPWKIAAAIFKWTIVLLLLPKHLPRIDMVILNPLSATTTMRRPYTPYSSSVVMGVDAEKVANPTDQFDIDESFLRVTIRHQTFHEIPSCQHRITQIELHNLVPYTTSSFWFTEYLKHVSNCLGFSLFLYFDMFDDSIPKKN